MDKTIGNIIQQLINNSNLTQTAVAQKLGISRPYLSHIVNNDRKPSAKVLNKIAAFFNVSAIELFEAAGLLEEYDEKELLTQKYLDFLYADERFRDLAEKLMAMNKKERDLVLQNFLFHLQMQRRNDQEDNE
jgi:transcriptional regulator with XRE-family HTH domain